MESEETFKSNSLMKERQREGDGETEGEREGESREGAKEEIKGKEGEGWTEKERNLATERGVIRPKLNSKLLKEPGVEVSVF